MSLEAWGDEDPADSLCRVPGCGCEARVGEETCATHGQFVECDTCTEWVDRDAIISYFDDLGQLNQCPQCFEGANYRDECEATS
jgi:hypothetical protein